MSTNFEVVVVGGGIVGAALGVALAKAGVRIALVEARSPRPNGSTEAADARVLALNLASINLLRALGVWTTEIEKSACPFRKMKVWDADSNGELLFDGADAGQEAMGWIVEDHRIVDALWSQLEQSTNASLLCPARVSALQDLDDGLKLQLDGGRWITTQLAVAADGASSAMRSLANIGVTGWAYEQEALVARVTTGKSHDETAYQRFLPEGPLAFLPLANGQSSIVWTSSADTTRRNLALNDTDFIDRLENASGAILGPIEHIGRRIAFPLKLQFANSYCDERVALLGDAAHSVHPLAGQGANLGLLDAAALAELIADARLRKRSIASRRLLKKYERWRKADNLTMLLTLDALNRLYGIQLSPFDQIRAVGMNCINRATLIKRLFIRYAIGARKDLPKLANGIPCWPN